MTNLLQHTEDMTDPVWIKTVVTVTDQQDSGQEFPAGSGGTLADLCAFEGSGRALRQNSAVAASALIDQSGSNVAAAACTSWTRLAAFAKLDTGELYILSVYLLGADTSGKVTLSVSIYDECLRANLVADSPTSFYVRGWQLERVPGDYTAN